MPKTKLDTIREWFLLSRIGMRAEATPDERAEALDALAKIHKLASIGALTIEMQHSVSALTPADLQ